MVKSKPVFNVTISLFKKLLNDFCVFNGLVEAFYDTFVRLASNNGFIIGSVIV